MTEQQRRAAATISLLLILVCATGLGMLALYVMLGTSPLGNRFPGREFILIIRDQGGLQTMLKALPILVSAGLTILANYKLKDWQYYATVAVTALGIGAAVLLYIELGSPAEARRFWAWSPVEEIYNYASFVGQAHAFLTIMGLWFLGVLGAQLGIKNLGGSQ